MVEDMIAAGGGLVSGHVTLGAFRASGAGETEACDILQVEPPGQPGLLARFSAWDARALDLPGRYYADVAEWLFRENRLAAGDFPVFGRPTPLARVACPVFALAGAKDAVAPPAQVLAALDLVGAPAARCASAVADCGHLPLFLGARTLAKEWVEIAAWMRGDQGSR